LVVSCGWSDDRLGRRLIRQRMTTAPALGNPATLPLISKGNVGVSGAAKVSNYFTNLNIWIGDSLDSIGATGKTHVRDPDLPPPAQDGNTLPPDPPPQEDNCPYDGCYVDVTDNQRTGPDVIDNDPTLDNMTEEEFFRTFLGAEDIDAYKARIDQDNVLTPDEADDTNGPLTELLGGAALIQCDPPSTSCEFRPPGEQIGSHQQPVVLVIDGDLVGVGNTEIWGIVYVTGDVGGAGTVRVYGGMIIEGDVGSTGTLDIIYDPFAITTAAEKAGRPVPLQGDWRDW
jgi:hypothetical protein